MAAHAIGEGGVAAALRAGVDSIEHGMFLDDATIELFLRTGARLTPTFLAPHGILGGPVPGWIKDRARPAAEAQVRSFRAAVEAGVPVAGTDAGTPTTPTAGWPASSRSWSTPACPSCGPSGRPPPRPPTSSGDRGSATPRRRPGRPAAARRPAYLAAAAADGAADRALGRRCSSRPGGPRWS